MTLTTICESTLTFNILDEKTLEHLTVNVFRGLTSFVGRHDPILLVRRNTKMFPETIKCGSPVVDTKQNSPAIFVHMYRDETVSHHLRARTV